MGHLTCRRTASAPSSRRGPHGRLAALAAAACLAAVVSVAAENLPELAQPVNDFAGVIDAGSAAEMDRMIRALQRASGDVVVVATVETFAPYGDIREYAVKLFENRGRGIGETGKHNGLLVLLAVNDRRVWIEVGYGLEEFITDGFSGETSRNYMVPAFRSGQFGQGLRAGVARIVGRIAEARGVTLDGVEPVRAPRQRGVTPASLVVVGIVVLFVILQLVNGGGRGGRFGGSRRTWGAGPWSGWNSGIGPFGGGGGFGGGGFGGGFGGFGGGRSGGGGGGAGW